MNPTFPDIFYSLVIVIFTKDGPAAIDKLYDSRFDCQVAEATMLTKARDTQAVIGWSMPADCVPIMENNKV